MVKVAPGHFRNHLMPKLLAVPNIDKFAHLISEQHKVLFLLMLIACVYMNIYVDNSYNLNVVSLKLYLGVFDSYV